MGWGLGRACRPSGLSSSSLCSHRAPARPTAPSGSSAAAPGTFCTITMSMGRGPTASNGSKICRAARTGKNDGVQRPRCAGKAEMGSVPTGAWEASCTPYLPRVARATQASLPAPGLGSPTLESCFSNPSLPGASLLRMINNWHINWAFRRH